MKQLLYILALFVVIACTNGKEKIQKENKPSVVVFEQSLYPLKVKTPFKNITPAPTGVPVISYSSGYDIKYYNPKKAYDTLVLDNPNSYAELRFACSFEDYNYLIAPNDTILFSIDEYGHPTLKSKTSKQLTELYNFPYKIKHGTPFLCYRPLTGLLRFGRHLYIIKKAQKDMPSLYEKFKHTYIPIDTLQKSFLFYQKNYLRELEDLKKQPSISKYIDYLNYRYRLNSSLFELSKAEYGRGRAKAANIILLLNDKYVAYPSYNEFVENYIWLYFNSSENIPVNKGNLSVSVDWRKTYEKLAEKEYPIKTKHLMQQYALKKMSNLFSPKSMQKYLDDYLAQTGDSITVNKIVNPHGLSKSEQKLETKALLLRDVQGNITTLEKVLAENKGYVIYADFWASWCSPCMRMMSAAKKLHEKYKDKKVKFLYFSKDLSKDAWESGMEKAGIKEGSYLILNPKDAPVIRKLKIYSIPRFLVFDKNSKLVEAKAPNPDVEKIEGILDKYLDK